MNRCIMIFPNFENIDIINKIRNKYDPLSDFIKPHITLVFPFESDILSVELSEHIKKAVCDCNPFNLKMRGFTASIEPCSNYIFLNVVEGLQNLYQLSGNLYTGILEKYQSNIYKVRYCPHLTVGNLDKKMDYQAILNDLQNINAEFAATVSSASVATIDSDESSILEMSIPL